MSREHKQEITDRQWDELIRHFPALHNDRSLLVAYAVNYIGTTYNNSLRNEFSLKARKNAYARAKKDLESLRASTRSLIDIEEAAIELSFDQHGYDVEFVALFSQIDSDLQKLESCLNHGLAVHEAGMATGPDKEPVQDYVAFVAEIFEKNKLSNKIGAGKDSHSLLNFMVDLCRCLDYEPQGRALADEIRSWKKLRM